MGLLQPHGGYVGGLCEGDWVTLLKAILGLVIVALPFSLLWYLFAKKRLPKVEEHRIDRWKDLGGA